MNKTIERNARTGWTAALISGLFVINSITTIVYAADVDPSVISARQSVQESTTNLVTIKDNDQLPLAEKEAKKFDAAKETLGDIVRLGLREINAFEKKLNGLEIEKLITDDYAFDAAGVHDQLAALLVNDKSYFTNAAKEVGALENLEAAQTLAAQIATWRANTYSPGIQKILSLDLVLRQKTIVGIGNTRFEKILNDLRRLKNAKLISLDAVEAKLRQATADQKIANSLTTDTVQLLLQFLNPATGNIIGGDAENYKRIMNLSEQTFGHVKAMYKEFMEINSAVKGMLTGEDSKKPTK